MSGAAGTGGLPGAPLSEERRRPLIDDAGRGLLTSLLEHPHAPRYNHTCGDRLTTRGLVDVQAFDAETRRFAATGVQGDGAAGGRPAWVDGFARWCLATVPAYRAHGPLARRFDEIPPIDRGALARAPWSFVPDDHPVDDMVVFTTTGTSSGRVAYVASTPEATASYAVLLRAALATRGLDLVGGPGRTAVAQVCWQRSTYTYAATSSFLGQAAVLKLNLNPAEWRDPDDPVRFLDELEPEVVTGDPVAFARLAERPVRLRPKALLSTAMALGPALRSRLEARFGCPVIDIYGMNEAGPIAAALPDGSGHVVLQPHLHVEVLDADGRPCPVGEPGEVTLTGGFNPALPLLRYRTGDRAALGSVAGRPLLIGLAGRPPVPLVAADGRALNTIDVTVALHAFALARFHVHQHADRSVTVATESSGPLDEPALLAALAERFGELPVRLASLAGQPEQAPFSTDLPLA